MSKMIMEKKICVEPKYLNENIREYLLEKVKKDYLLQCDSEKGYIVKIYDNIQILDNTVATASPNVFFRIRFQVKALKPEAGCDYEGKVCMIFPQGIFVEVLEKMKVLVPVDKLGNYKYVKGDNIFQNGKKKIERGQSVQVMIDLIRYEKQNFSCIGSLKSK